MRNSFAAGRRLAARVVLAQIAVSVAFAGLFAIRGWSAAAAALCGGLAVALGSALLGLRAFAGQAMSGRRALAGLLAGVAAKWIVVAGVVGLALGRWHLPALPLLATLVAVLLVNVLALRFT